MPVINVHNKSNHNQEFEVHGYNNNKNIVVPPQSTTVINAPDGTSGAVIALHDGIEGEQAEITKCGWGGNDFFDVSVIVGAGGNMTMQQVGDPSTRKGHPLFMQECNAAWHRASAQVRESLHGQVFLDALGNVKRIGPPKNNAALEAFVRTFAEGKVYIGIGAWGNNKGDAGDNAQSSAGHGSKDLIVTYHDDDATPGADVLAQCTPTHTVGRVAPSREEQKEKPQTYSEKIDLPHRPHTFQVQNDSGHGGQSTRDNAHGEQINKADTYGERNNKVDTYGQRNDEQRVCHEQNDKNRPYDTQTRENNVYGKDHTEDNAYGKENYEGRPYGLPSNLVHTCDIAHSNNERSGVSHTAGVVYPLDGQSGVTHTNGVHEGAAHPSVNHPNVLQPPSIQHNTVHPSVAHPSSVHADVIHPTNVHAAVVQPATAHPPPALPQAAPKRHPAPPTTQHHLAQGPGIILTNHSPHPCTYYFYDNYWNGTGTAGANFDKPLKNITLPASGAAQFVPLPTTFKGRVQRGSMLPATWAEFQVCAADDGKAHGDISLQQGCDGAATITATDGSMRSNGFVEDIVAGAPEAAVRCKADGSRALDTTVGNWMGGPNSAAIEWEHRKVGRERAYVVGGTGVDDVASGNMCLAVDFY